MALTKIRQKNQVTLPDTVRTAAGLKVGDLLDATVVRGGVFLRPKAVVDKVELDRRLGEALADVKAGRVSKPYKSARALVRDALGRGRERSKNRTVR
jgi:AbrB family looped-hinge helix DNA binding protein